MALLALLYPLVHAASERVHSFLIAAQVQPYFALPWVLTWFSHSLQDFDVVCVLFDAFLCHHPLLPLYVAATVRCCLDVWFLRKQRQLVRACCAGDCVVCP